MREKQKLDIIFEDLFPEHIEVPVGGQKIVIAPLSAKVLMQAIKEVKGIVAALKTEGVDIFGVIGEMGGSDDDPIPDTKGEEPTNIEQWYIVASVIADRCPGLLAETANLEVEALLELPLPLVTEILLAVVKVNLASKKSLIKNLNGLVSLIKGGATKPKR